jgi:MATE family multidrug resistance protein
LFRLSLLAGLGFALLFLTALFISPDLYYRILTSHTEVIGTAATYDIWLWPTLLFGSLAYMYDGLFLGLTAGRTLRRSMMFSTLVVFLPPAIIAVYLQNNHLLWGSLAFFMIARAATLGWAGRSYLMEN